MSLDAWQERLAGHFRALADRRSVTGWPVFALEHGLSGDDLKLLLADVTNAARVGPPKRSAFLPWVVYAAEFGYRYSGYEYWQTFALETPGWAMYGQRESIRQYFQLFSSTYCGAEPEGAWADHFSIIAWPITHAVLPCDLQRRLAQLLFEARHTFRDDAFESAEALGRHLQSLSHHQSSRFIQFAENVTLLGQIAGALLLQDPGTQDGLLSSATLERLVQDIGRERASKEWLSEAASSARQVRGMRGLHGRRSSRGQILTGKGADEVSRQVVADLGIEPRLMARPTGRDAWDVCIEIPSLLPLQSRFRTLRLLLERSRGVFVPSNKPIARQGLLFGLLEPLRAWPVGGSALVRYDACSPDIKFLFDTVLCMPFGPRWILKVLADGRAAHIKGNVVHPGASYILLGSQRIERPAAGLVPLELRCSGIYGIGFEVPNPVDDVWDGILTALGLKSSRLLEVWPVGYPAAYWDDEGSAQWLEGKELVLAVAADFPIGLLFVRIGGQVQVLDLTQQSGTGPTFVSVGTLPEGKHRIELGATGRAGADASLQGCLDVLVRPPRVWSVQRPASGPVRFLVDPLEPTLEELWEGRVDVHLSAPGSAAVRPSVRLVGEHRVEPLFLKLLAPMNLPVSPEDWRHAFQVGVRELADAQAFYDEALACRVDFDAGVLGRHHLTCERAYTPLRWVAKTRSTGMTLRLVDNSGRGEVEVREYDFASPDRFKRHPYDQAEGGIEVDIDGGLYLARGGTAECAIVAMRTGVVRTFGALQVRPRLTGRTRDEEGVLELLEVAHIWSIARVTGSALSSFYRLNVRAAVAAELAALLAGEVWSRAERAFAETGASEPMKRSVAQAPHLRALASALWLDADALAAASISSRVERLVQLSKSFPIMGTPHGHPGADHTGSRTASNVRWAWELALRMASEPEGVTRWAGSALPDAIRWLLSTPAVYRAARYLVLIVDQKTKTRPGDQLSLLQGWAWA